MRQIMRFFMLTATILSGFGWAHAATYTTIDAGNWQSETVWDTTPGAPISMNQSNIIIIEHNIVLKTNFEGNNEIKFIVRNGATLRIEGNFNVGNRCIIEVETGSNFIITGSVDLSPANSSNNLGTLVIDGSITVEKDLLGNGVIEGNGEVEVDGTMDGMDYTGFEGKLTVSGETLFDAIPGPTDLLADVSDDLVVSLTWEHTDNTALEGDGKVLEGYSFVGYQIFRNLGGYTDQFQIIKGDIVNGSFTGDTVLLYVDGQEYNNGDTPRYNVRAVYFNTTTNEYKFSSQSNMVDFSASPLPVDLLYFRAQATNGMVQFNWITASEINNHYFTIQRSHDGQSFEDVATIASQAEQGFSNRNLHYSAIDAQPLQGISYYRLKQTDFDGTYDYSQLVGITIKRQQEVTFRLFPNPNHGSNFNIALSRLRSYENMELIITDLNGRGVYATSLQADHSGSLVSRFDTNLLPGIYVVSLTGTSGRFVVRLIVR